MSKQSSPTAGASTLLNIYPTDEFGNGVKSSDADKNEFIVQYAKLSFNSDIPVYSNLSSKACVLSSAATARISCIA
jgi:hypothetical protein